MIKGPARLAARRGDRSDTFFRHLATEGILRSLVEHCLPGRRLAQDFTSVVNHDDRAALICTLSALCVATGDFVAIDDDDGWIIRRPPRFIQPAQWALLKFNADEEQSAALHIAEPRKITEQLQQHASL